MAKFVKRTFLLGLIVSLVFVANLIWFKPFSIRLFYEKIFLEFAFNSPELLSQIHIVEQFGIKSHQRELDDVSQSREDALRAKVRENLAMLRSYDRQKLDYQEALSYDVLEWFLAKQVEGDQWRFHNYPVNQLFGLQNNFPSFMDTAHAVKNLTDAKDYVTRLSKIGVKFEQAMEGLRIREEKGIIPPTFVIEKVLTEMQGFVDTKAEENILYVSLQKKLKQVQDISDQDQNEILADAKVKIETVVYPAYRSYIGYFTRLKEKSTSDDGVWKLPNGDAYYAYQLALNTTIKDSPEQIHQLGLSEVARVQAEMREILASQGYDVSKSLGELMRALASEPRFLYPDSKEGREQILTDYQSIIDEISRNMGSHFASLPEAAIKVERVPEFKEKTAPGAYYNPPAMDGSRPGIFYANLWNIKATPKFGMRTLAYHEGVPGHHYQIATAQEVKNLPIFRRMMPFTAFAEGWALYAERVAWEAGFQKDPFDNLGRLQAELFRSVRLVVDTGIHAKRWTRQEAIDYMLSNTGMAESDVVAEIERYIVNPGQACAYKVGMMKLLSLREEARQRLGDRFDIREFHSLLLKNGSLPLDIVERLVRDWIARA